MAASVWIGLCGKASMVQETPKRCRMKKNNNGADDGYSQVDSAKSSSEDKPMMTGHPKEPCEIDHPICCPHPEPCIIQDEQALKERRNRGKRVGQLPFLTKSEVQRVDRNCQSTLNDYRRFTEPS